MTSIDNLKEQYTECEKIFEQEKQKTQNKKTNPSHARYAPGQQI